MEFNCKNCGEMNTVKGIGRKRLPIPFNIVSKHLRWHVRGHRVGQPHLLNTAKDIYEIYGIKISAGFVKWRLLEEARDRGMSYDELLAQIRTKGKAHQRLSHIKKAMVDNTLPG